MVIVGYSDRMRDFLNSNPGVRSRFSKTLDFDPWSADEFALEMNKLLVEASFSLDQCAVEALSFCAQPISESHSLPLAVQPDPSKRKLPRRTRPGYATSPICGRNFHV